ncbi:MAG: hypothetical protein J7J71_02265 [Deltaproteobacteria bacterium]|nr:hypothetical protein [Candidatus Tharpella sp.]
MGKPYSKLWQGMAIINFNSTIKKIKALEIPQPEYGLYKTKKAGYPDFSG